MLCKHIIRHNISPDQEYKNCNTSLSMLPGKETIIREGMPDLIIYANFPGKECPYSHSEI